MIAHRAHAAMTSTAETPRARTPRGLAPGKALVPRQAVLSLRVTTGSAGRGALLAFAYCLGLWIPFNLTAMGRGWVSTALAFVRRHIRVLNITGAAMLIILGVLMVTGHLDAVHLQNLSGPFLTPI